MTASLRRTVIVSVVALAVAIVLVGAATTQPARMIGDRPPSSTSATRQATRPAPGAEAADDAAADQAPGRANHRPRWVGEIATVLLVLMALSLLGLMVQAIARRVLRWLPDEQLVLPLHPLPDVEAAREALRQGQEEHRAALAGSDVRNAIVACWVLLEEAAAEAGFTRLPAETTTEFAAGFLHALDIDPLPVATLAGLFREARFSTHALPADRREGAEVALAGIHHDLERVGVR